MTAFSPFGPFLCLYVQAVNETSLHETGQCFATDIRAYEWRHKKGRHRILASEKKITGAKAIRNSRMPTGTTLNRCCANLGPR